MTVPLSDGGAAGDAMALLGARHGLVLEDRTGWPRFGLKGPGSADWLRAAGVPLPAPNRVAEWQGARVLRLGNEDIALLDREGGGAVEALRARWQAAPGGHSAWREEGWGWLALSGPALDEVLAGLCAVDLRPGRFGADAIAQTRFAGLDAVVLPGAEILFDITATADMVRRIADFAEGRAP